MKRVLLIDDDPVIGKVYGNKLAAAGYSVQLASDGAEGLAALKSFQPDVVLLDLEMPGVSGVDWLREVRSYPTHQQLPIIVFTSGADRWQMKAAWESDAMYVLTKAATKPEALVEAVGDAATEGRWPH
jgi:CheY-like chemotaxis protein